MTDYEKQYWIKIFVKKCISLNNYKEQVDFFIEWCSKTYNVSGDLLEELKEKYSKDDYIDRLIPVIDKYFTLEDLQEAVRFYSKGVGKKMLEYKFLQEIGKVTTNMGKDMEQDFAVRYNKQNDKTTQVETSKKSNI